MNRLEFLEQLEDQLQGFVSTEELMESVSYYKEYIDGELAKGKSEEEIFEKLGSPNSIAKSIIDASGGNPEFETVYEEYEEEKQKSWKQEETEQTNGSYSVHYTDGWKAKLVIIGILLLLVLMVIFAFKVFVAMLPFLIPFALIMFLIKLFTGRR